MQGANTIKQQNVNNEYVKIIAPSQDFWQELKHISLVQKLAM
jgi:hypothetical protein